MRRENEAILKTEKLTIIKSTFNQKCCDMSHKMLLRQGFTGAMSSQPKQYFQRGRPAIARGR